MPESPVHAWISETKNAIRSVISKPKATDRLLNRPPFRFLYDVITVYLKNGEIPGENSYETTNAQNRYLVEPSRETRVSASRVVIRRSRYRRGDRPQSYLISGEEPEKTGRFLVQLVSAARQREQEADYDPSSVKSLSCETIGILHALKTERDRIRDQYEEVTKAVNKALSS